MKFLWFLMDWWYNCIFQHEPENPIDGSQSLGQCHPYYRCRKCHCLLKWKPKGGWEVIKEKVTLNDIQQ